MLPLTQTACLSNKALLQTHWPALHSSGLTRRRPLQALGRWQQQCSRWQHRNWRLLVPADPAQQTLSCLLNQHVTTTPCYNTSVTIIHDVLMLDELGYLWAIPPCTSATVLCWQQQQQQQRNEYLTGEWARKVSKQGADTLADWVHGNLSAWILGKCRLGGWCEPGMCKIYATFTSVSWGSNDTHSHAWCTLESNDSKPFDTPPLQSYTMHGSLANLEAILSAHWDWVHLT